MSGTEEMYYVPHCLLHTWTHVECSEALSSLDCTHRHQESCKTLHFDREGSK